MRVGWEDLQIRLQAGLKFQKLLQLFGRIQKAKTEFSKNKGKDLNLGGISCTNRGNDWRRAVLQEELGASG